jgi:hypothetical protein
VLKQLEAPFDPQSDEWQCMSETARCSVVWQLGQQLMT